MIFDDIFYPENPRRRQEVANLRGEIITIISGYKNAWNENVALLNEAFQEAAKPGTPFYGLKLTSLKKDINSDPIGQCIDEINNTISETNAKLNKLMVDIGLDKLLPNDWKEKGAKVSDLGKLTVLNVCKAIETVAAASAAAFLGYYIFAGISVVFGLIGAITGVAASIGCFIGGALTGMIIGGVVFIISDLIASAITGAIEREQLKEAVDSMTKLRDSVLPLRDAAIKLAGINQNIKDGNYKLAPGWYLMKDEDGNYIIFENGKKYAAAFTAA